MYMSTKLESSGGQSSSVGLADAEIYDIIRAGSDNYKVFSNHYDRDSQSNILVYGDSPDKADWVSYLDHGNFGNNNTHDSRLTWASLHNIGGTFDWAIDLEESYPPADPVDTSDPHMWPNVEPSCPGSAMP